jgi:hypothetical protein
MQEAKKPIPDVDSAHPCSTNYGQGVDRNDLEGLFFQPQARGNESMTTATLKGKA